MADDLIVSVSGIRSIRLCETTVARAVPALQTFCEFAGYGSSESPGVTTRRERLTRDVSAGGETTSDEVAFASTTLAEE